MPGYTVSTQVTSDQTVTTTAETVVATLTGVGTSGPGRSVRLTGELQITTGGSSTAVTLRVRRDSLTGTVVGEGNPVQLETAAGSTEDHDIETVDTPTGEIYNATYVLTVQVTAAAANSSVLFASLKAQCE